MICIKSFEIDASSVHNAHPHTSTKKQTNDFAPETWFAISLSKLWSWFTSHFVRCFRSLFPLRLSIPIVCICTRCNSQYASIVYSYQITRLFSRCLNCTVARRWSRVRALVLTHNVILSGAHFLFHFDSIANTLTLFCHWKMPNNLVYFMRSNYGNKLWKRSLHLRDIIAPLSTILHTEWNQFLLHFRSAIACVDIYWF